MGGMHHVRGRFLIYTLTYTNFVEMLPTTGAVALRGLRNYPFGC